jgi:hypothetical protein
MAGFVVKATVPDGEVSWLSPPTFRGLPRLRHREAADVFETLGEAYAAMDQLPSLLGHSQMNFTIEPAG